MDATVRKIIVHAHLESQSIPEIQKRAHAAVAGFDFPHHLENPATILDLGCGPGNSTAALRRRWPDAKVTGLDNPRR